MDLTQLLGFMLENNASDLHLSAGSPPIIRVDGVLRRVKAPDLNGDAIRTMLYSVMRDDQRAEFERDMELDFAFALGDEARFRVNAFTSRIGTSAVMRAIPDKIPTMEDLNLPTVMRKLANLENGLVLVTGATGSGKSTTLASIINHINENSQKHILTIEDPVEFFHTSKKALINHREVGVDTINFKTALKSALREDPDVILVGEMRDYETIALALTAAETGHLVFGTLHSSTAAKAVDRIIDVFPANDKEMIRSMMAGSIQAIIAQQLLSRAEGKGRVAAFEILVGTNAVRNLIRENQIPQVTSIMQTGSRFGMTTMDIAISNLLEDGLITEDIARKARMKVSDEEGEMLDVKEDSDTKAIKSAASAAQQTAAGQEEYAF